MVVVDVNEYCLLDTHLAVDLIFEVERNTNVIDIAYINLLQTECCMMQMRCIHISLII